MNINLKSWRKPYTQKQAAEILGVPLRAYQEWEQGRVGKSALGSLLPWALLSIEELKQRAALRESKR